ncbi:MAG: sulfotransferase family 2 domain-containing protein [Bacteroidota bacterium]
MKVSHHHKYVFVELPQTASSAVGLELVENYGAENFKQKHALFHEFKRKMGSKAEEYFVFSAIRNPIDVVVSKYLKYLNNHHNYHSANRRNMNGRIDRIISPIRENGRYNWIQKNNADFESFFFKYFKYPFTNWSVVENHQFDYIMRFENIRNDFAEALGKIGLDLVRELPVRNKTDDKAPSHTYFQSQKARDHAVYIFGPFMELWGYKFPDEWGDVSICAKSQKAFERINKLKTVYWKHFH